MNIQLILGNVPTPMSQNVCLDLVEMISIAQSKYDTYSFAFILKNNLVKKPEATLGQYSLFSALCDPQLGPSLKGSSNYQLITHYDNYKGEDVKEVCPSDGCFVFVNLMFILESKLYKIADYEVFTHV